jgi:hypothetical protein
MTNGMDNSPFLGTASEKSSGQGRPQTSLRGTTTYSGILGLRDRFFQFNEEDIDKKLAWLLSDELHNKNDHLH